MTWTLRRKEVSPSRACLLYTSDVYKRQTIYCLKLAALMVKELAGGTISSEIKDVCAAPAKDFRVDLAYEKVNSLIGKVIPVDTIKSICLLYTSARRLNDGMGDYVANQVIKLMNKKGVLVKMCIRDRIIGIPV